MTFRISILLFALISFISTSSDALDPLKRYKALAPEKAPVDLVFKDLDGAPIKLSDYKGKLIILNFWATWCMPCIAEMPSLNKLAQLYKHDDFVVIAIAKDKKGPITPKEFRKRTKFYQMIFAMDAKENGFFERFKVKGLPTTIVINEEGMVVGKLVGGTDWAHEDVLALMQSYIEGEGPEPTPISLSERLSSCLEFIRDYFNNFFKSEENLEEVESDNEETESK